MDIYKPQFSTENITQRIKELLAETKDEDSLAIFRHEFVGGFDTINDNIMAFLLEDEAWGRIPEKTQLQYGRRIQEASQKAFNSIDELIRIEKKQMKEKDNYAQRMLQDIINLGILLPSTTKIPNAKNLDQKRKIKLQVIDDFTAMLFYTYNRLFAENYQTKQYYLKSDIETIYILKETENKKENRIVMYAPAKIARIRTKVDYCTNVLVPLIKNIEEHGFNPENDSEDRLQNPDLYKYFKIETDKPTDSKGYLTITVKDNGFGIKKELYEHLFTKNTTRKQDKIKHGLGLYGIKLFVEKQGGIINCRAEEGKSCEFSFTIPYTEKRNGMYIQ